MVRVTWSNTTNNMVESNSVSIQRRMENYLKYLILFILIDQTISIRFWEDIHLENGFNEILKTASHRAINNSLNICYQNVTNCYDQNNNGNVDTQLLLRSKRAFGNDPSAFRGKPKTKEERWHHSFNMNSTNLLFDQSNSLVTLLVKIVSEYMTACTPIVLYDQFVEDSDGFVLQSFFKTLQLTVIHGKVDSNFKVMNKNLLAPGDKSCKSYILFLSDVLRTRDVLGPQTKNRVLLVPRSTQWKLQEFLTSKISSDIVNLLVIGDSLSGDPTKERPYVLYTHKLYTDGLGSNVPIVLTSWIKGRLSRPNVNLFPQKYAKGFAGHRFSISSFHQPPFIIKKIRTDNFGNVRIGWDGIEYRLLDLLSKQLNFTYEIIEPLRRHELGSTFGVIEALERNRADIGICGAYVTDDRLAILDMSVAHSRDCASFLTLASKALPRYRAIMGPFQWQVWVSIVFIYLVAIFPLAFSDRLTLKHLIGNWGEIENMFWYVFGTFTNSLTFTGQFSWSNTTKMSTRLLIGWYWIFTIIITACYTSSIIAFVTLPAFPKTVDTITDLIWGFFRIGTLENDGWQYWFTNSTHVETNRLLRSLEYVANAEEGLSNVTKAFFWPYAFLASRSHLEYIVQINFTDVRVGKRSALHISEECFVPFGISFLFRKNSVFTDRINDSILRIQQSGLINQMRNELQWLLEKSSSGRLLQTTVKKDLKSIAIEDRGLTLTDTEGMFLLMGIGYSIAASVLVSEIVGGCAKRCKEIIRRDSLLTSNQTSTVSPVHPNSSCLNSCDSILLEQDNLSDITIKDNGTIKSIIIKDNSKNYHLFKRRYSAQPINDQASDGDGKINEIDIQHRRHNSLIEFNQSEFNEDCQSNIVTIDIDSNFGNNNMVLHTAEIHQEGNNDGNDLTEYSTNMYDIEEEKI